MKTYKYETHLHTSETSICGKVPAEMAVYLYSEAGYDGMAVTDHYYKEYFDALETASWEEKIFRYLKGYRNAVVEGLKTGLKILLGMEIRFHNSPNDYLIYGLDEAFLNENKELYLLEMDKFKALAEKNKLLVFQAHPFRNGLLREKPSLLDGVEVYNAHPRHDSRNPLALQFARENGLIELSGSDFHQVQDAARGGILLSEAPGTSSELVSAIKNGAVKQLLTV